MDHSPDAPSPAPPTPPTFQRVVSAGATDRGLVRENNEDHFVVAEMTRAMHIEGSSLAQPAVLFGSVNIRGHLFVVADGMGGHKGGEEASALAVVTIEDFFLNMLRRLFRLHGDSVLQEFQQALRAADDRIFAEAERRPELRGMGTTVTLAYAIGRVLYVAHAGDSRMYLMRAGTLHQLTNDHTLVGELVRNQVIPPENAATHPMRNIVINSVGGDRRGVSPELRKVALEPYDTVLLCTDGLTGMVSEAEIAAILAAEADPAAACALLIERANVLGGHDNVTTIVARFLP